MWRTHFPTCTVDLGWEHGCVEHLVFILLVDDFALAQVGGELSRVDVAAQHVPVAFHILPQGVLFILQCLHVVIHSWPSSWEEETPTRLIKKPLWNNAIKRSGVMARIYGQTKKKKYSREKWVGHIAFYLREKGMGT